MAIVVTPKKSNDPSKVNLITAPDIKLRRISRVKSDLDRMYIEAETKSRAAFLGIPYIDLYGFPIDTQHLTFLKKEETQRLKIGVFSIRNKELYLATPSPGSPGQKQFYDQLIQDGWEPKLYLCSQISFDKIIQTYSYVVEIRKVVDEISLNDKFLKETKESKAPLEQLGKKLQSTSLSKFVETVLTVALAGRASDIHFEPEKEEYNIRLRIDGVLHTVASLPVNMIKPIESRLKVVSGLKLNIDNIPQDGRFSFKANEKEIDVRVSMLPSNYGYSVVMRLLGTGQTVLELSALGFTGLAKKRITAAINKPQGMILTTGPTGSGKTTTLYTILSELNDGKTKIITLEDPIEYKLKGISQTQIDSKAGYTFASGLRSILRQDPDIVMVGEIRDRETAEVAVQASLTGHQVLSTVHTNDAAGAIPRLMEMEVMGYLLADSLSAIVGQRLVRRICTNCKSPVHLTPDQEEIVRQALSEIPVNGEVELPEKITFYEGKGCQECNGLGYKGRIGIYEVLAVTDGLRKLLSKERLSIMEVREIAQKEGMVTMLQDGIVKAIQGITSISEVLSNIA